DDAAKYVECLRLTVAHAYEACWLVSHKVPLVRGNFLLGVAGRLGEMRYEAGATLVVCVFTCVVERDDPEHIVLTPRGAAHFAGSTRVMNNYHRDLAPAKVQQPAVH